MTMRLLDLFSGAGGSARGYQLAGFHVTGVDNRPQPRYAGDVFVQDDALEYVAAHGHEYDCIHASPPCQAYSNAQRIRGNAHPDLIAATRAALIATGKPYIIENVPGAPLRNPTTLVGSMFGLRTMRPRLFETSFPLPFELAPTPAAKHAKMGRLARPGEYVHVVGKAGRHGVLDQWKSAMGIDWMTTLELAQAVPPAYTLWIGQQLLEAQPHMQFAGKQPQQEKVTA